MKLEVNIHCVLRGKARVGDLGRTDICVWRSLINGIPPYSSLSGRALKQRPHSMCFPESSISFKCLWLIKTRILLPAMGREGPFIVLFCLLWLLALWSGTEDISQNK